MTVASAAAVIVKSLFGIRNSMVDSNIGTNDSLSMLGIFHVHEHLHMQVSPGIDCTMLIKMQDYLNKP